MNAPIGGTVAPGFEAVRDAFAKNFAEHGEVGAAVAVYRDGEPVVDLWGGVANPSTGAAYGEDALQLVFSTTKGATAICASILAQRGLLDVDAPVVEYWPEFKAEGKENIPVRMLLCHQAGLISTEARLSIEQVLAWDPLVEALAAQRPYWEPGTKHGYHALTYGHLVGEVVRRIDGRSLGRFFAEEVAAPLGLDFWIGLPESKESRVAPLIPSPPPPPEMREMMELFMGGDSLAGKALTLSGSLAGLDDPGDTPFNRRDFHAAEIPAANGITTARSLAKMYASTIGEVDGFRSLEPKQMERARTPLTTGPDACLMFETKFGLGFMTYAPAFTPMLGEGSFGHAGAGGSLGFAHPDSGVAFGYVMNQMQMNLAGDPRPAGLIEAVRAAL